MPVMDGFEAAEKILQYQKNLNLKNKCEIVALTAFHSQETTNRCFNIGMKAVYTKPASMIGVKEAIYQNHFDLTPH